MKKIIDAYTAGEFRHHVVVNRATKTANGAGGFATLWALQCVLYCDVIALRGSEDFSANATARIRAKGLWRFVTPWGNDVTVEDQLVFEGQTLNIRRVVNVDFHNKFTAIDAEYGVES